jgi:hypothetical protein
MSILSDSVKNINSDKLDHNYFGLLSISEIYLIHEKFRNCYLFPSLDTACHNTENFFCTVYRSMGHFIINT